jgi:hypothetical protein
VQNTYVQLQLDFYSPGATLRPAKPLHLARRSRPRRKIYVVAGRDGRVVPVVFRSTRYWQVNQCRRRANRFLCVDSVSPRDRAYLTVAPKMW